MNKSTGIGIIAAINLAITAFCAFGGVAFTSNVYVRAGRDTTLTPMAQSGSGALYRYSYCIGAALFLIAVLAIFNLSALRFVESNGSQVNRLALAIAGASFGLMLLIYVFLIGLNF